MWSVSFAECLAVSIRRQSESERARLRLYGCRTLAYRASRTALAGRSLPVALWEPRAPLAGSILVSLGLSALATGATRI
jgi:hypothetical protein